MVYSLILEGGWWLAGKTYDLGHYMIYGRQETVEEKILREIEELKEQGSILQKSNEELRRHGYEVTLDKDVEKKIVQQIEDLKAYTEEIKRSGELERLELLKDHDLLIKKINQLETENNFLKEGLAPNIERTPSPNHIYECYKELAKKR